MWVYILTNARNGTLYTGVTNDLARRVSEHREGTADGFTRRYGLKTPVWFERHATAEQAIVREKKIKRWPRTWKLGLIEQSNPQWSDLFETLNQ